MTQLSTHPRKILVVEDEVLIADYVASLLTKANYEVLGPVMTMAEAIAVCEREEPELVLLDIRLEGERDGIDLAAWLRAHQPGTPFVFVTSQFDERYLGRARATAPAGYLTKPIVEPTLLATVAIALPQMRDDPVPHQEVADGRQRIVLDVGPEGTVVALDDIRYLRADHVYVEFHLADRRMVTIRETLAQVEERLPADSFWRIHRSYIINERHVTGWTSNSVQIGADELPLSRYRRAELVNLLRARL